MINKILQGDSFIHMTLPTLPKTLNKREALWSTKIFRPWLEKHGKTAVYEVKVCITSLPFSAVAPHQIANLLKVRHGTFVYKIKNF